MFRGIILAFTSSQVFAAFSRPNKIYSVVIGIVIFKSKNPNFLTIFIRVINLNSKGTRITTSNNSAKKMSFSKKMILTIWPSLLLSLLISIALLANGGNASGVDRRIEVNEREDTSPNLTHPDIKKKLSQVESSNATDSSFRLHDKLKDPQEKMSKHFEIVSHPETEYSSMVNLDKMDAGMAKSKAKNQPSAVEPEIVQQIRQKLSAENMHMKSAALNKKTNEAIKEVTEYFKQLPEEKTEKEEKLFENALIAKIAKYRFSALFEESRNQYWQPKPDQDIAQFKQNVVNQVLGIFEFAFEKNMNMQNNLEENVKREIQIVENAAKFYLLGVKHHLNIELNEQESELMNNFKSWLEKNVLGQIIEPGKKNKKTEHEMGEEILNSFIRLFTNDQEVAKLFKSANVEQRMGITEEEMEKDKGWTKIRRRRKPEKKFELNKHKNFFH